VTRGDEGEVLEINWRGATAPSVHEEDLKGTLQVGDMYDEDLKGTLPVGDMHMPYLEILSLIFQPLLTGEARGVGVAVVNFTDCVCE